MTVKTKTIDKDTIKILMFYDALPIHFSCRDVEGQLHYGELTGNLSDIRDGQPARYFTVPADPDRLHAFDQGELDSLSLARDAAEWSLLERSGDDLIMIQGEGPAAECPYLPEEGYTMEPPDPDYAGDGSEHAWMLTGEAPA